MMRARRLSRTHRRVYGPIIACLASVALLPGSMRAGRPGRHPAVDRVFQEAAQDAIAVIRVYVTVRPRWLESASR